MADYERMQLLAEVADLYYLQDLSQSIISEKLGFSRSKASRLLREARESGVVEVRINFPLERIGELEKQLADRYNLTQALVMNSRSQSESQMLRSLGRLGAYYLSENLKDGCTLGISWGTAVYEVAQAIRPRNLKDLCVVQIIGSIGYGNPAIDGPEVARKIAQTLSGRYYTLNSPVIVQDKSTRDGLLNERNIQEVMDKAIKADYILVGIGSSDPARSGLVRAGYISEEELTSINQKTGAVGDICARLFDIRGEYDMIEFNERVVGISLSQLKTIPAKIVGIAGGENKAPAILGALNGGLVDILITDDEAAKRLLQENGTWN